jgi:endoribonuclease Dicer
MLLRHVLDEELERRASGQAHKVAFFLVEKVALCFQQHAVLSTNLDHPIGKLHGDMTGMMKTTEFWDAQTSEYMAIICTAQILLDCLNSGLVTMTQINLLVLDEAHHTKKNHPYARIIKDHYIREPKKRPRILGMTASPVDAQTKDLRAAAMELESLLCSEIATVSDKVLFENQARRQQIESKAYYRTLQSPEDCRTQLWDNIVGMIAHNVQFRAHLEWAAEAASTLGPWCADRIWKLIMTDTETARLTARTGQDLGGAHPSTNGELAVTAVRSVQELVVKHDLPRPNLDQGLSSKVLALHEILEDSFCIQGTKRCIIFVEKRYTACLLADLFQQKEVAIPGMLSDYIVSSPRLV